jgi:chorismate mutase
MKPNSIPSAGTAADSSTTAQVTTSSHNSSKPLVGSSAVIGERENELANKWIKELYDAGYTPDEMISVFREARRKFEDYKKRKQQNNVKKSN